MSEKFKPLNGEAAKKQAEEVMLKNMRNLADALGPDVISQVFNQKDSKPKKDAKKSGEGFTVAPSLNYSEPGKHSVEFRPGASNIDAIEKENRQTEIKGDGFTVKPSKEKAKPAKHSLEFRPGASNVEEIEK